MLHQDGRRGVGATAAVDIVAAIDAAVVEDDGDDRQVIAANGFDLHAAEAEGAVTFDGHDRLAADDRRADRIAHTDAHHPPGPAIKAFARHAHVDNVAGDVQRVCPLVDEIDLRLVGEHAFDGAESTVEIHRVGVGGEVGRHELYVVLLVLSELIEPCGTRPHLAGLEHRQQGRDGRGDIPYDWRSDGTIAVHLRRRDIQLNELRRRRPLRALTVAQQPVQPRADQHHHIGLRQCIRSGRRSRLRVVVGQQALGHGHGQERDPGLLDECANVSVRLRISRTLAEDDERPLSFGQHLQGALD